MHEEELASALATPSDIDSEDDGSTSNELLDIFGPAVVVPVVAGLFWGASPAERLFSYVGLYAVFTLAFGTALWTLARRFPQHYERGETLWSMCSGVLAATLPWIIAPEPRWSHYALGLIFAAVMASDTIYIALRPNEQWKSVLCLTTLSYATFLAFAGAWAVSAFCVAFGLNLLGGHDAVQELVRTLRHQRSKSEELALTDALTGLANRRGLTRFVEDAIADPTVDRLAVASVDIDNFKQINDRLGHHGGDAALQSLADYMTGALGETWLVARSGGDEFVCVSTTGTAEEARQPFRSVPQLVFEDAVLPVKVSVGFADGAPDLSLLADASAALRLSKQRGKHQFTAVDSALREELREARKLGAQLNDAIQRSEIQIWAQPIVHVNGAKAGEVHSYECLARWRTVDGISIPPSSFIPMVEDQRLTRELGELVITKAAAFAAALDPGVTVAVNVFASHFTSPGFPEFVLATLEHHGLKPDQLTLEMTESEEVLGSMAETWPIARQLRSIGVGLAIDDFGTGYASLDRLMRFPCSQIKLDRSIVTNAAGTGLEHLLTGFALMSSDSGMEIVAEGVEDIEQHRLLQSLGLPLAQGYLFGRPEPVERVMRSHRAFEAAFEQVQKASSPSGSTSEIGSVTSTNG